MALSLFDHHRRLHDLEHAFEALLDLMRQAGVDRPAVEAAARRLRARGQDSAAALLTQSPRTFTS